LFLGYVRAAGKIPEEPSESVIESTEEEAEAEPSSHERGVLATINRDFRNLVNNFNKLSEKMVEPLKLPTAHHHHEKHLPVIEKHKSKQGHDIKYSGGASSKGGIHNVNVVRSDDAENYHSSRVFQFSSSNRDEVEKFIENSVKNPKVKKHLLHGLRG
jgi:hypothetical protein